MSNNLLFIMYFVLGGVWVRARQAIHNTLGLPHDKGLETIFQWILWLPILGAFGIYVSVKLALDIYRKMC